MIGQGLRSNPKGLALSDQTRRHTLMRPVGKVGEMLDVVPNSIVCVIHPSATCAV